MFYREKLPHHPTYQEKTVTLRVKAIKDNVITELAQGSFNVSDYCNSTQQFLRLELTGMLGAARVDCEVSVITADQQSIIGVDYDNATSGVSL